MLNRECQIFTDFIFYPNASQITERGLYNPQSDAAPTLVIRVHTPHPVQETLLVADTGIEPVLTP